LQKKAAMKLRFEKNSVRYRLRKSDIEQLTHQGFIKDSVAFPGTTFTFELHVSDVSDLIATFVDNTLITNLPLGLATEWINTDEVGINHVMHLNNDQTLEIIVEKDFPCKHDSEEVRQDTFTELAEKSGKNEIC
jgi:hypothetical protein